MRQRNLKSKKTFYKGDNPKTTNICILKSHIANVFSCTVQLGWMLHRNTNDSYRGQGKSFRNILLKGRIVQGTENTQSDNCRFLVYIPSWWKNKPWLERVGGALHSAHPPPDTSVTITYKVAVYAPAEKADTLHLFHLHPIFTLWFKGHNQRFLYFLYRSFFYVTMDI